MQAPRESDLPSSVDVSKAASSGDSSKDEISSFVAKKVGGRERKIRRKVWAYFSILSEFTRLRSLNFII